MTDEHDINKPIVMVIASLRGGGAERVMTLLANEWVRRGRRVSVITLEDSQDAYALAPEVERVRLGVSGASRGKWNALRNNWRRLKALRRAILQQNPAVVISFMDVTNILTLLATRGSGLRVIVSERIDPRRHVIGAGWQQLRRQVYPWCGALVVQTRAVADWAEGFLDPAKVHVIANPVQAGSEPGGEARPDWLPEKYIVAMGRLHPQKGFDLLLKAYGEIAPQYTDLHLVIMGEGMERSALELMSEEAGLKDRVMLPGRIDDPWPVLRNSVLFVLSSRYEGFPNALLEAMALGVAVVSFDCPSGPADVIRHNQNGLLVEAENPSALAKAIDSLLKNKNKRQALGRMAKKNAADFSISRITDSWEKLF